jgi:hypothetical protein
MHEIMDKKFYLGPKFGTLFNRKWITISELLHFPKVELLESCKKWQKSFFYVKNTTDVDLLNLPPFVDEPP